MWPQATHFHFRGKIASLSLIFLGIIKFFTDFFRANSQGGHFLSLFVFILGVYIFYKTSNRSFQRDFRIALAFPLMFFSSKEVRNLSLSRIGKNWYNTKTSWSWKWRQVTKFFRRIHVKPTPKNIQ